MNDQIKRNYFNNWQMGHPEQDGSFMPETVILFFAFIQQTQCYNLVIVLSCRSCIFKSAPHLENGNRNQVLGSVWRVGGL